MSKNKKTEFVGTMEIVEINGIQGVKRGDIISAMVPTELIVPAPLNPNKMKEETLKRLKQNVDENGFLDAVNVIPLSDGKTFQINGGEHRWTVAKQRGMKEIPVDIMFDPKWQDEAEQEYQLVRFNVIKGEMDPEKMVKLYNKAAAKHGSEKVAQLLGYTNQAGLNKVIKQVSQDMKSTLPPELSKQFEEQAKEATSIGDLNKIIQNLFKEHGDTVKHSFMVFTYGGKEHIYIAMNKTVHEAMKKILAQAKEKHLDVNDLLADAVLGVANMIGGPGGNNN